MADSTNMNPFQDFYKKVGFFEYPFSVYTAENEKEKQPQLFVPPSEHSIIVENFNKNLTMVVIGERGVGKTALIFDLIRSADEETSLIVEIEDFSQLPQVYESSQLYEFLIRALAQEVLKKTALQSSRVRKLDKEQRYLLSYLLAKYTTPITKNELKKKILAIQKSKILRALIALYNIIRYVLNYGLNGISAFVNDAISRHLGIPIVKSQDQWRQYLPEALSGPDTAFVDHQASYSLLQKVLGLCEALGFSNVIVVLDKIDEDSRLDNDGELVAEFIKPLLTDNKLLTNQGIQLVVSLWAVSFSYLQAYLRSQKHSCPRLKWAESDLILALNRRIEVYSCERIKSFRTMLADDIDKSQISTLFELANGSPRDLWHAFDKLMHAQFRIDPSSNQVSRTALEDGITQFVKDFNYYEHYPRRANAKASTMDIYAYIKHLQKLDDSLFTKDKLNRMAGTGSSTSNYVSAMEVMGLITRDGKEAGGNVVYRIKDPKIIYSILNKIEIRRD